MMQIQKNIYYYYLKYALELLKCEQVHCFPENSLGRDITDWFTYCKKSQFYTLRYLRVYLE